MPSHAPNNKVTVRIRVHHSRVYVRISFNRINVLLHDDDRGGVLIAIPTADQLAQLGRFEKIEMNIPDDLRKHMENAVGTGGMIALLEYLSPKYPNGKDLHAVACNM